MSDSDKRMIWLDGELVPKAQAKVSVYDHRLLYGDGVFEGLRAYGGHVFEENAHLVRLYESAKAIRLVIPHTPQELAEAMKQTMAANGFENGDCYLRLVVTRGVGDLGLDPNRCPKASVFIIADTIRIYPQQMYDEGMSVITSSWQKNFINALPPRIKSLNYLNSILAKIEANDAGVPEAIMLNHLGEVAECTADNVFLVQCGIIRTPPASAGILKGITRDFVMQLARRDGFNVKEKPLLRHDLYTADEVFLTGTAAEVIGVTKIDGRVVGQGKPGPITKRLKELFHRDVRGGSGEVSATNEPAGV
jgi:branched-chain amino acid aminotransferase